MFACVYEKKMYETSKSKTDDEKEEDDDGNRQGKSERDRINERNREAYRKVARILKRGITSILHRDAHMFQSDTHVYWRTSFKQPIEITFSPNKIEIVLVGTKKNIPNRCIELLAYKKKSQRVELPKV